MAISGWSIWEVHSAGNDANGGGFDPNATMTSTLSATSATTTNPVITASNYTFISDDIGHFLYIKSGSSWYPGWYKILSISSGSAIVEAGIGNATQGNGALNILQGIGSSNTLSSGTWAVDYSQKPTPYKVYTDLYTYTNTGVNSAVQPFTPNLIGNVLNVTGGTNYFTGRFVINSVTSGNAALDRTIAPSGTSGGQANLGGALGTVPFTLKTIKDFASSSYYIKVFMKNDNTYNVSVNSGSLNYTSTEYFNLIGYGSVRGDNQKVTVSINNNNISWITGGAGYVPQLMKWFNIKVTGNGYTTSTFAWSFVHFNGLTQQFTNCEFSDMTLLGGAYGISCHFDRCYFKNLTGTCNDSIHSLNNCTIEGCSNPQFWGSRVYNCLFINNGGNCVFANGGMLPGVVKGCTFYNNSTCVWIHNNCNGSNSQHTAIYNNIFANNSGRAIQGIGLNNCGEHTTSVVQANAFYLNSGGNFNNGVNAYNVNMVLSIDNVILSASPFISTTNKDFRLNNVIGGGASCIGKGSVSAYYNVPFVNALDIGAVQSPSNNLDKTLGTLNKPITIKAGTTSYTEFIYLSTTGYTSSTIGLKAFYIRPGSNNTQITLTSQTVNGAWVSGGFVEVDPINMPGLYRFDVPNVVLSSGVTTSVLQIINQTTNDKAIISYKFQDPINLNLTQAVPTSNIDQTVGDALNSARAYGFGKWAITGNTLEYYSPIDSSVIKSFELDNSNYPRRRGGIFATTGLVMNLDAKNISSYPGSGNTWFDLTGNGNNVTLTNGPTWNALGYFVNDADSYFTGSGTPSIPTGNSSYSMFVYVRSSTWGDQRGFISIGGYGTNNQSNALRTLATLGHLAHYWWFNDLAINNNNANIALNKWFYVGATFDGTTRKVYVDGILVGSDTPSNHNVTSTTIQISKTYNTEYQVGDVAAAQIYNRALTIEEVGLNLGYLRNRFGL